MVVLGFTAFAYAAGYVISIGGAIVGLYADITLAASGQALRINYFSILLLEYVRLSNCLKP